MPVEKRCKNVKSKAWCRFNSNKMLPAGALHTALVLVTYDSQARNSVKNKQGSKDEEGFR